MSFELSRIKGIGPAKLRALNEAGIYSVTDLALHLPAEYRDLSNPVPLSQLRPGMAAAVRVRVCGEARVRYGGKLKIVTVCVTDGEETINVVWFNQPWLKDQLTKDRPLLLYGKAEWRKNVLTMVSPVIEQEGGLVPVYRPIGGIAAKAMHGIMESVLDVCDSGWVDTLPVSLRSRYHLCERNFALRNAHFPTDSQALEVARYRLSFEELLLYQVALSMYRNSAKAGVKLDFDDGATDAFWNKLPFKPTGAQRHVLEEIAADLRSDRAMARMVQGDVGSGKTAVAFAALALTCGCGYQGVLMAPTEVLARQHYDGAREILEPLGYKVGLLTGSLTPKQHKLAHEAIASGEWDVIIGTHALITEGVEYKKLGIVITDEQHRFGVRQRSALSNKGESPNVLVMSATPIPRSLSLILYGDLDISVIDELPPGRKPVATRIVPEEKRSGLYGFLREEIGRGRQVYVVCPLVEESEAIEARPAEQVYEDLKTKDLPELRIGLVHGRMRPADKDAELEKFRKGETDILVSTTVIEVGVNVPNATIMIVENAERFGLAQLHQLRGRVGRGAFESWCFLMSEPNERLRFMCSTNDGFKVAQKDMELRGPGELFGTRQSGAVSEGLNVSAADSKLLKETHDLAHELLRDPDSEETKAVIALAIERYAERLAEVAMN